MQFIIHTFDAFWVTLAIFLGSVAGVWFFWGRHEFFKRG
jgi:hypothetical protein